MVVPTIALNQRKANVYKPYKIRQKGNLYVCSTEGKENAF